MYALEHMILQLLQIFFAQDAINGFLGHPQTVAIMVGSLIALAGAIPGTFLLLRGMSLTTDAISHTVLLGIVVAFIVLAALSGTTPDLSSPLLILGAAAAGVATVILTEALYRSGLVRQDAALGLAFPLLFAISIILVSRYISNVHLDTDSVMIGEIGVAWTDTTSHCFANCEEITITEDDRRAVMMRECTNCVSENLYPRDDRATFEEMCSNCGTYTPGEAWSKGYSPQKPELIFFPRSLTVMGLLTVLTIVFVLLFYKELKLATFDSGLAASLGLRPGALHYALMTIVSLVAVGAFNAVGSVLVVAFFIIPAAGAYLLTDRLSRMLIIAPIFGVLGATTGYELSRGNVLGLFQMSDLLKSLDGLLKLNGYTDWNVSISASMVIMLLVLFIVAWVCSPRYGLITLATRRWQQSRQFADVLILGHIANHEGTPEAPDELNPDTLHEHFHWSRRTMQWALARLRAVRLVQVENDQVILTERGRAHLLDFRQEMGIR